MKNNFKKMKGHDFLLITMLWSNKLNLIKLFQWLYIISVFDGTIYNLYM